MKNNLYIICLLITGFGLYSCSGGSESVESEEEYETAEEAVDYNESEREIDPNVAGSITIDAGIKRVWATLSDLDGVAAYDLEVKSSRTVSLNERGMAAVRENTLTNGNFMIQRVGEWIDQMRIGYISNVTATPWVSDEGSTEDFLDIWPIQSLKSNYMIHEDAEGITVEYSVNWEFVSDTLNPVSREDQLMFKERFNYLTTEHLKGLKKYIESGVPQGMEEKRELMGKLSNLKVEKVPAESGD
jgi:hypothetical protein